MHIAALLSTSSGSDSMRLTALHDVMVQAYIQRMKVLLQVANGDEDSQAGKQVQASPKVQPPIVTASIQQV